MVSFQKFYPYLLAFFVGVLITAAELSATPLLAPAFGTSLIVWTVVIGVVLGALALGYFLGGRLADRSKTLRPLLLSLAIGAILIAVIPFVARFFFSDVSVSGVFEGHVAAWQLVWVLIAMLVLFAFPMVLLSMTSPYVIAVLSRDVSKDYVGRTAGRVYAISTIGSLIGVFIAPLVTLPLLGTRQTFLLFGALLLLLVLPGLVHSWKGRVGFSVLVVGLLFFLMPLLSPVLAREDVIDETESFMQYIAVTKDNDRLDLRVNEGLGVQSSYYPGNPYTGFYTDTFPILPLSRDVPSDGRIDVLLVGLAGGAIPRTMEAALPDVELHITGVEIDSEMVRMAREYMDLDELESLSVVVMDGRAFLRSTDETYDYIFIDAFQNETTIPPELATQEFFEEVQGHLESDGIVAMNVASVSEDSDLLRAIQNTLASVFSSTYSGRVVGFSNNLLFAFDGVYDPYTAHDAELPSELESLRSVVADALPVTFDDEDLLLTDDRSPVHLLTLRMFFDAIQNQ